MTYQNQRIADVAQVLKDRYAALKNKQDILRAVELKALYAEIPTLSPEERGAFGRDINQLKKEWEDLIANTSEQAEQLPPIDVTAPFDRNTPPEKRPSLLPSDQGSAHPLMQEREVMLDIFYRMGFTASESRELESNSLSREDRPTSNTRFVHSSLPMHLPVDRAAHTS